MEFMGKILVGIFSFPKAIHEWLEGFGVKTMYLYLPVIAGAFMYFVVHFSVFDSQVLYFILTIIPIFLPFLLFPYFFDTWGKYIHGQFSGSQGSVLLEVRIPREITKSPEAMEQVFMQLYQKAGPDNLVEGLWSGKTAPSYSFEIVSREGQVHFYIHAPRKKFKNAIETHLYAQYPGIEVREVPVDYTAEIPVSLEGYFMMGFQFGKPKPISAPFRTYVDWGHLDFPKEEEKIDPLGTLIETFGGLGPGEHYWLQIIIEANRKSEFKNGVWPAKSDWKGDIEKIAKDFIGERKPNELSDIEKLKYQALQRNKEKYAFDTTIRGMYLAKSGSFNGDHIGLLVSSFRGTDYPGYANIIPRFATQVNWPWWQDWKGKFVGKLKKDLIMNYKLRSPKTPTPRPSTNTVMTTEELATLWHPPSSTVTTPTLQRIESTRSEAPSNLPV